jgi:acyl-coenzyme A synthetase/AMP-(fatty) acid ligase
MYGLTEAFRSTYLDPGELDRRPGSIGKALPGQEILVLDESGAPCGVGQPGELVHRGSLVTLGYWNDPEQTRTRYRPLPANHGQLPLPEFAVWSGDLVRTDEDGFLYFVGRKDQLLKTSGHRISAGEIEEVVAEVGGVVENAVVGLADELLGHRLVAALVCVAGEREAIVEAVRRHCRRQLPAYMTPADICVLEFIPRNVNGKPDRAALETILRDRLKH